MSLSLKLCDLVDNIHSGGTVSQIFYSGPTFYFMVKNRKLDTIFLQFNYIHFIK